MVIVSYMEIYNDRLYDLLQPYKPFSTRDPADMNQRRAVLEVREDARGATYVPNLLCVKVKSYKSVYQLIAKGNRNRAVRHTEMNQASSRSHAILQLVLEQWPRGGADGTVIRSKLNFVDLAGSERWSTAAAAAAAMEAGGGAAAAAAESLLGDERISEMTAINGSLSALGSVVAALTERRPHVPYRDSKLTHLLQDSLGGNCRTTLLATLSPSQDAFEESCSTLRFADRARAIANNPVVNASRDVGSILALKEREIARLRAMLAQMAAEQGTGGGGDGGKVAVAAAGSDDVASRLAEELEATRRALQLERALRAELQQRLHTHVGLGGGGDGDADGGEVDGGALGDPGGGPQVLTLGTPATAFDAAGSPSSSSASAPRRSSSLRSSGGGGRGGGGVPDYLRVSTPSTPLNPVPEHLAALAAGGGGGGGGRILSPTNAALAASSHGFHSGGAPGRARSNLLSSQGMGMGMGPAAGVGTGAGGGRGGLQRRLSFDEAIMSIKSQIVNLSAQERARSRARQPLPQQPRALWPPPPPQQQPPSISPLQPGLPLLPPPPPPAASGSGGEGGPGGGSPPANKSAAKVAAMVGIYGGAGGGASTAVPRRPPQHPSQRQPPLHSVPSGMLANGGGAFGSLTVIRSIEMTDSSFESEAASPGGGGAGGGGGGGGTGGRRPALAHQSQSEHIRSSGADGAAAAAAAVGKSRSYPNGFGHSRAAGGDGGGGGLAPEPSALESDCLTEEEVGAADEEVEEEEAEVEEEEVSGLTKGRGSAEAGGRGGPGEEQVGEEGTEAADSDGGAGRGAGGGRCGNRSDGGGGSDDDDDGGLLQLDPEEYAELMRQAREALARGQSQQGSAAGAGAGARPAPGAGPGGGRVALTQPSMGGASSASGGGGWGRNALLTNAGGSWAPQRRSRSVGPAGRPHGGSRGGTADRVAKLDAGSWIYILGASASSTRAKQLASALQLDPRTGLPAI
ncbi:hypothetical protein GPECTOR_59g611 [Gonium pectorale]|uniref:Kinesin-like protein n=1 Tax=Gonium pectorale TaxID=33097 RepID=A0A150G5A8_GONPE|nr:hypothetical protein GPECTOR_59g611 [Gonium pectorale]|eukprot:KXZ45004.1 hypothetical protein GPECTOR_59g611 [Gonium pectorale]